MAARVDTSSVLVLFLCGGGGGLACDQEGPSPDDPDAPARVSSPHDGSTWVLIPGGTLKMGSPENLGEVDEHPQHAVTLKPFYIQQTLVTNEQYATFLDSYKAPPEEVLFMVGLRGVLHRPTEIRFSTHYRPSFGYEDHPVITLSYDGARQYCHWAQGELPTEAQWEWAARGGLEGKRYPWGDEFPEGKARYGQRWNNGDHPAPTVPVASFEPNGYDLYDMAGQVWQWTQTRYQPYGPTTSPTTPASTVRPQERYAVRGGDFSSTAAQLRVAARMSYIPYTQSNFVGALGVRCVSANPSSTRPTPVYIRHELPPPALPDPKPRDVDTPLPAGSGDLPTGPGPTTFPGGVR